MNFDGIGFFKKISCLPCLEYKTVSCTNCIQTPQLQNVFFDGPVINQLWQTFCHTLNIQKAFLHHGRLGVETVALYLWMLDRIGHMCTLHLNLVTHRETIQVKNKIQNWLYTLNFSEYWLWIFTFLIKRLKSFRTCSVLGTRFPASTPVLSGSPLISASDVVEVDDVSLFIIGFDEWIFRRCKKNDLRLSNVIQHEVHYKQIKRNCECLIYYYFYEIEI